VSSDEVSFTDLYREILNLLDKYDKGRKFRLPKDAQVKFNELSNKFKEVFIDYVIGDELPQAHQWLKIVKSSLNEVIRTLGLTGFTFPKEFRSFIEDPLKHLKKKLFNYVYDLYRGKIDLTEFIYRASAAIRTSLKTNLRTAYQVWGLMTILTHLGNDGFRVIYPEHKFLSIDRWGKQKLGIIPPNVVLHSPRYGYLSFFHEVPRPLTWEDSSDLQRVWSLYTALRPDLMVYGGAVMNIVDLSSSPPIKRPTMIIEFKELEDWYVRVRDLKGYFRKSFTAEEWRSRWITGLYDGLADILGIQRREVEEKVEKEKSLRVREYQLVQLYYNVYKPKVMILISRKEVPSEIKRVLKDNNIEVFDAIEFNKEKLKDVTELIKSYAEGSKSSIHLELDIETYDNLVKLKELLNLGSEGEVIKYLVNEFMKSVKSLR